MSNVVTSRQLTRATRYRLNNGQHIPVAGFGVYLVPKEQAEDLVYEALVQGYRHIDSAVIYGNEEQSARGIERFIKDSNGKVTRGDIWFTTKIWNAEQGYEETKKAVQGIASRVKKHIGYVDLVLIHSPKTSKEKRLGTWKALQEFVLDPANDVLQINTIGVSNFGAKHIDEILNWDGLVVPPAVDQLELHPWLPQVELREYLASHNILAEAYSPLTQGIKLQDPELLELEQKYRVPKAEILLKWSYLQGFIVLVKTVKKERIKENLSVLPDVKAPADALDDTSHSGKIDLDINILEALNKPDSHEVLTWGHVDPTQYEG
ncbi:hypothetical protein ACI3LY_005480 [Candidozyma auris]|uniref:2-dehydropantolactone reductase n=2 Tax=Candidozyma auris TaxID=498019 RepID=A0AB36W056_CANAR|nr:hypothetical_protein [[Candida] auris]KND96060.1 hypothetical protein QG37_07630 [[Candida] auris]PIS49559.1 hypothetical protein B9J08_004583 [[Candida] auris]PIS50179.1 hypothetical protein CJI97_004869 [[Candida] auris]QEO23667.1 hypothetical_protein [[Candida] auris]QRG39978.1 hypothetical protein FDK38_004439 [[Candida] auris]